VASHFLSRLVSEGPSGWRLVNERTGRSLADRIETAFDSRSRRRGLLNRTALPIGFALIIAPCAAVHTFGMKVTIDVVFARRDGRVLKVRERVGAGRLPGAWRGFAAVELPSGAVAAAGGVEPGDVIRLDPPSLANPVTDGLTILGRAAVTKVYQGRT
jgi:hypothetical protein